MVALGGTSYAAISVSGKDIRDGTVAGVDLRDGSVAGRDVKNRSLAASDLSPGTLQRGPRGRPGPAGSAFSLFHDLPIETGEDPMDIAKLEIPVPGSRFILANATASDNGGYLDCILTAEDGPRVDSDRQVVTFKGFTNFTSTVTHTFDQPGVVTLNCDGIGSGTRLSNIKITAIPVESLTNKPF